MRQEDLLNHFQGLVRSYSEDIAEWLPWWVELTDRVNRHPQNLNRHSISIAFRTPSVKGDVCEYWDPRKAPIMPKAYVASGETGQLYPEATMPNTNLRPFYPLGCGGYKGSGFYLNPMHGNKEAMDGVPRHMNDLTVLQMTFAYVPKDIIEGNFNYVDGTISCPQLLPLGNKYAPCLTWEEMLNWSFLSPIYSSAFSDAIALQPHTVDASLWHSLRKPPSLRFNTHVQEEGFNDWEWQKMQTREGPREHPEGYWEYYASVVGELIGNAFVIKGPRREAHTIEFNLDGY